MEDAIISLVVAQRELIVQSVTLFLILLAFAGCSLAMLIVLWRMIRDILR